MNIKKIAWKELWERPTAMITSLLAIALVGTASMSMCFAALRGRLKRG